MHSDSRSPLEHVPTEIQMHLWGGYRRSGDRRLRDRLVVIFAPIVHHIVREASAAGADLCDLEDLVSAGLEAMIRAIDHYDPDRGDTLERYLWARVHDGVRDELARCAPPAATAGAGTDGGADPARMSARSEARLRFRHAFRQLPERERHVAVMRHVEGLSLREIGGMLGVTESRVCQIDARARRELRVTLADDEALLGGAA